MAAEDIDAYLAGLDEPSRTTLEELRRTIVAIIPEAQECISYGMPAFRLDGTVVAGFAAFKHHLSYLPHSGSVLDQLPEAIAGYSSTKGSLHFPLDQPLPEALVRQLIQVSIQLHSKT